MTDIILNFHDYSHVYVETKESIFRELKSALAFYADGYQFHPKFKYGTRDGKISLLDNDRLLPIGLVPHLTKYAKTNEFTISIHDLIIHKNPLTKLEFIDWMDSRKYYSGSEEIVPYWYQVNAVFESLTNKRRILNLPTSAGKSLIQAMLTKYMIENTNKSVLILVPTVNLCTQMKDDLIDYRLFKDSEIGLLKSGSKLSNQRVVVSTWQSAIKKPADWFDQFGMLLCDEMHLAIGKSISTIIKKLKYCEYKIGLSGSLRDGKANLMQYVGLFGGIYNPVTTAQLMEEGQVTKLKINSLFLKYPEKVSSAMTNADYPTEIKFITSLQKRTDWVANLAMKISARNENSFIMFKHLEHGKKIHDALKAKGHTQAYYVAGDVTPEERNKFKKMAEEDSGIVIIASYGVFSTGISVKNLHHVIFAHPVKSKIIVLQTVGRVLRKHKSKAIATIWDLIDDMSISVEKNGIKSRKNVNYALKHGIERLERYGIENFDYSMKDIFFLK